METLGSAKFVQQMKTKKTMADSRFALSNQNIVEQLEENEKKKTKTRWKLHRPGRMFAYATERKVNSKTEEYEHEQLEEEESATE